MAMALANVCIFPLTILALFITQKATADGFEPQFERCTLEIAGKTLTPLAVRSPWAEAHRVGTRRVILRESSIEDADVRTGRPAWSVKSEDGSELRWLAAAGDLVFLEAENNKLEIRRFDVAAHKWITALALPVEKKTPKQIDVLTAVLADAQRLAVLTRQYEPGDNPREWKSLGCRLTLFRTRQDKPEWSQPLPAEKSRPDPDVHLWAAVMPDYADSKVKHLNWLDDGILLCAGEKDDLVLFDRSGKVKWRVPKVWEYQRGFIGPSVWSHYIARFGDRTRREESFNPGTPEYDKAVQETMKELAGKRAAFDNQYQCAIVGGPIIVPTKNAAAVGGNGAAERIFVAIAKGPNDWNWGYLSDCLVYELTREGTVASIVNLPRMVNGNQFTVMPDGLVWGCQSDGMVRLAAPRDADDFGVGPGAPDLISAVDWYRQFAPVPLDGWLTAGKVRDAVAFGATHAFRAASGGYVSAKNEKIYRFPLSVVDLKTASEVQATVSVPFKGEMPLPKTNMAQTADDKTHAHGFYLLGITRLQLDGDALEVTLGLEHSAAGVTFDLGFLSRPTPH